MRLIINGKPAELPAQMSIADFLCAKGLPETSVAVEHNLKWVKREQWATILLSENDRLEVVRIVAGG